MERAERVSCIYETEWTSAKDRYTVWNSVKNTVSMRIQLSLSYHVIDFLKPNANKRTQWRERREVEGGRG